MVWELIKLPLFENSVLFTTIRKYICKEKKASDALGKLRASNEEVRLHAELLCSDILTHIDRFKMSPRESFTTFLIQLRVFIRELMRYCDTGIKKKVDVNFAAVNEILQAVGTGLSHLGRSLNSVGLK